MEQVILVSIGLSALGYLVYKVYQSFAGNSSCSCGRVGACNCTEGRCNVIRKSNQKLNV